MILMATGHRKPYSGFKESDSRIKNLKTKLNSELERLKPQIKYFISGGAMGWDTWTAEAALSLNIPFYYYKPYSDHGINWQEKDKIRHDNLFKHAEEIIIVCDKYSRDCFLQRDKAMIDNSTHVISLLNPLVKRGGTFYTVNLANKVGIPVYNFWKYIEK